MTATAAALPVPRFIILPRAANRWKYCRICNICGHREGRVINDDDVRRFPCYGAATVMAVCRGELWGA